MPIQVQRKLPEIGRIRIGRKGERGQPQRLTKFRLTSKDRKTIEGAAGVYGGKTQAWAGHDGEWEVFTASDELAILVAPDPISQWYEIWSAGGCKRRCDGETCQIPDPKSDGMTDVDCMCDPENRECGIKTRASFILPDLPGLGRWRLDTGSYYAAAELPGQIELLQMARGRGQFPEAVLAIETREYKRQVKGVVTTFKPSIVTIRFRDTIRQLLGTEAPMIEDKRPDREHAIGPGAPKAIEPVAPSRIYLAGVIEALKEFGKLAQARARDVKSLEDAESLVYVLLAADDDTKDPGQLTVDVILEATALLTKGIDNDH